MKTKMKTKMKTIGQAKFAELCGLHKEYLYEEIKGTKGKKLYLENAVIQAEINADLTKAHFERCTFESCHFENATLKNTRFYNCDVSVNYFKNCIIEDSVFWTCDLSNTEFVDCKITFTGFEDNDMYMTFFQDCNLKRSFFERNHMRCTKFRNTSLYNTGLGEANLSQIDSDERVITIGPIGTRNECTNYLVDKDWIWCGCWGEKGDYQCGGKLEEFERVINDDGDTLRAEQYKIAIQTFKAYKELYNSKK